MAPGKKVDPYEDDPDQKKSDLDSDTSVGNSSLSDASFGLEGVPNVRDMPNNESDVRNAEVPADVYSNFGVKSPNHRSIVLTNKNLLIFVRNSEHMNKCFPDWLAHNFVNGKYKTSDMNQPKKLYARENPVPNYGLDPPLTVFGARLASLLGKDMVRKNVTISAIYSSPSLRCIETALRILEAQRKDELKIRIEPALFDFHRESSPSFPAFMTRAELVANKFPIDVVYDPIMSVDQLKKIQNSELAMSFAKRCQETLQTIVKNEKPLGVALIVTHACTIHVAGRALTGRSLKRKGASIFPTAHTKELERATPNYPYCSMLALRPTPILENATTAALSKFIGGEKFHVLGGDGITKNIDEAQWGQVAGLMPTYQSSNFNNRFDHAFFTNPA